jgi:L-cystine uptake protein TcyP (sodium:dicarboxylate symporter family)
MVAEELVNIIPTELIKEISFLTKTLQAVGGIILLYIIFGVINLLINKKKNKEIRSIKESLEEIKKILKKIRNNKKI